ncbi:cytochrome P450 [Syncephalis plumigaleata]|nr:cytochrome P450 [Syncephalis plumigaleata]
MLSILSTWPEVAVAVATIYLVHKVIKEEFISPLAKVPGPRPASLNKIILSIRQLYHMQFVGATEAHRTYGPIVRVGPKTIWISDSTMIRKVNSSYQYNKGEDYESFRVGEIGLFTTRDANFHRVRKRLMLPAFTPAALNDLEPIIYDMGLHLMIQRLYEYADNGQAVDLMDLLKKMTLDTIGEVSFGKSFGLLSEKQEHHPIFDWINSRFAVGVQRVMLGRIHIPFLSSKWQRDINAFDNYVLEAIEKRRASQSDARRDTLQQLMEAVDEETGATLSDSDLITEAISLIIAGTDTTALGITWIMHYLLSHPECLHRLTEEILQLYPDPQTRIAYRDVISLPYLDAVLHEVFRIEPAAPQGMPRVIPKEGTTLGNYFIPGGTVAFVSLGVMQMNSQIFPNPHEFKPERWLDCTPEQLAVMKQNIMPFLVGPRACLGRNLAWMELRMVVVELIRHFTFTPSSDNDMTPTYDGPARPRGKKYVVTPVRRV